jgi:hypothetical protein
MYCGLVCHALNLKILNPPSVALPYALMAQIHHNHSIITADNSIDGDNQYIN